MKKSLTLIAALLTLILLCASPTVRSYSAEIVEPKTPATTEEHISTSTTDYVPSELESNISNEVSEKAPDDYLLQPVIHPKTQAVSAIIEEKRTLDSNNIEVSLNQYGLELPISGATGYTTIDLNLYSDSSKSSVITTLEAGTAFRIISEEADLWNVETSQFEGWIKHKYCMINLPDVIPSMVYDNTNSYRSMYRSVGYALDGITDETLYNATAYSTRFSETQYLMPVLYQMAKKICLAQNEALRNGYSLKLYEGFRPSETQVSICDALGNLMNTNSEVKKHISNSPWGKGWFISLGTSNHQRGCAMDVSLVNILSAQTQNCGDYPYVKITQYEEFEMPTSMHELSNLAVTFAYPVDSKSKTAWKSVELAPTMTEGSKLLQKYCTESGLTPLASEWWHFNDLDARESVGQNSSTGKFMITENCSQIPN